MSSELSFGNPDDGYGTDSIGNWISSPVGDIIIELSMFSYLFLSWSTCLCHSHPPSNFPINETGPVCFNIKPGNHVGPDE